MNFSSLPFVLGVKGLAWMCRSPQDTAGLCEWPGDLGGAVLAHHPLAINPLAVEPGDGMAEKAPQCWFLLICQHLDVRQTCGVVDRHAYFSVKDAGGAALAPDSSDPVAQLAEPGQGFDVDVDPATRLLPPLPPNGKLGFKISQTSQF